MIHLSGIDASCLHVETPEMPMHGGSRQIGDLPEGALKRYRADDHCHPSKPLIAGVPVSLREAGNTDPNNQVSMMMVSLAIR